jgi:hypothetical protein
MRCGIYEQAASHPLLPVIAGKVLTFLCKAFKQIGQV